MKEKLYTIPLTDAMKVADECPFCYIERKLSQEGIEFVLGASYMESDIRAETANKGFCRSHLKNMYDYGNYLGNAWILSSYLKRLRKDMEPGLLKKPEKKASLFGRKTERFPLLEMLEKEEESCYLCERVDKIFDRYVDTFFHLMKSDDDFFGMVADSKGFCIGHFKKLLAAGMKLPDKDRERILSVLNSLMETHLARIQEDIDWFIEKYDYRNNDADWKNSKDAVPRTIQKITGGYPGDGIYKSRG